ncbi:hypothetical protein MNBD_GAMMA12-2393 [hydrothermal vent metagenome]|uniref:Phytol kinase n=1 Tax=hydrothermal vent metagenome TaxID=652676 RepID=A0A3B0YXY3_9ZZZZ
MKDYALIDSAVFGLVLVPVILLLLLASLRFYQVKFKPHPETVRKLMHSLMGVLTLSFPWLFQETWPVWVLAASSMLLLFLLRTLPALKAGVSNVLNAVERNTLGEIYFPLAVATIFQFSNGVLILYLIPVMVLSFADAMAAIVGLRYGHIRYQTCEGQKSLEGSVAFLLVTTLCVHIPLLLLTDMGRSETLLIALLLGILVMLFEAIAWRGLDNLFIPFACFFLLQEFMTIAYLNNGAQQLSIQLAVVAGLSLIIPLLKKRTTMDGGASLAVVLVIYMVWSLQPIIWLFAPLSYLICYSLLAKRARQSGNEIHSVFSVLSVSAPGFIWIFVYKIYPNDVYLYAFVFSYSVQLAMTGIARLMEKHYRSRTLLSNHGVVAWAVLQGWSLIAIPVLVVYQPATINLIFNALFVLFLIFSATWLFFKWQPDLDNCPVDIFRWYRQGSIALLASALYVLIFI